jgi:hypothetical protein
VDADETFVPEMAHECGGGTENEFLPTLSVYANDGLGYSACDESEMEVKDVQIMKW